MSDVRSLPDTILRLYLGGYALWGVALLGLFGAQRLGVALTLLFPLAVFHGLLTLWWAKDLVQRHRNGDLERYEVDAAVKSVGHILAAGSLTPGIVFLAQAPLQPSTWALVASIAAIGGAAYVLTTFVSRFKTVIGNTVVLTLAWIAMPLNATGAVSVWTWIGFSF